MARLAFSAGEQKRFLGQVGNVLGEDSDGLGKLVGISGRSFRDWMAELTLGEKVGLERLSELSGVALPEVIEERAEYWSAKKYARQAALARLAKHGPPGTPEGRRKGGLVSQQRRRENPDFYRSLGCNVGHPFLFPSQSKELAELVGILLGDGGITPGQIRVTLNSVADKAYIEYVSGLVEKLFGYTPTRITYREVKAVVLLISGRSLVDFLLRQGLRVGDKVKNQVEVPWWIQRNREYSKWCLRGLMDTDGGIFTHRYVVNGNKYHYLKACFSNMSQPLRKFVFDSLVRFGFNPKFAGVKHVWLYSETESRKYLSVIGSSNKRLLRKSG